VRGAPGHRWSPAKRCTPVNLKRGPFAARRRPRARMGSGDEVKVPSVEPFTQPVLRDFAQDVMDVHLAQVDPDEMA
jgi:hypothetical protein